MKKSTFVLGLLLSLTVISFAQEHSNFQKFISNTFETKLGNLDSQEKVPEMLTSFSRDLTWRNVNVAIDGKVEVSEILDKAALQRSLNQLSKRASISMTWEITKYHELTKRESSYIASMAVTVKLFANGKLVSEGVNNIQIVAVKKSDFFEIQYMDILQISKEEYRGNCYVRITSDSENSYVLDIAYPNGNEYTSTELDVTIVDIAPYSKIVIDGENLSYYWNTLNQEFSSSKGGPKLGTASTIENALLIMVKSEGKPCNNVIRTALKK